MPYLSFYPANLPPPPPPPPPPPTTLAQPSWSEAQRHGRLNFTSENFGCERCIVGVFRRNVFCCLRVTAAVSRSCSEFRLLLIVVTDLYIGSRNRRNASSRVFMDTWQFYITVSASFKSRRSFYVQALILPLSFCSLSPP